MSKKTSEYSRYGYAVNPGYAAKSLAVHSQTAPTASISWSQVAALSHSASVGRRAPWLLAKASASNQEFDQLGGCRPFRDLAGAARDRPGQGPARARGGLRR